MCSTRLRGARRCHDPARRPRRVLRVGRAAARSIAARSPDRGRRRRGAGRLLRGQALRGARRHVGMAGQAPVPRPDRSSTGTSRSTSGSATRYGDPRRLHPARAAHLHRRGLPRRVGLGAPVRPGRGHRRADPRPGARRDRPADLGRRSAHQAPRQDRLAGGQARRPGRGEPDRRARVPRPAARRARVGHRPGDASSGSPSAASAPSAAGRRRPTARCVRCSDSALGTKVGALAANDDRAPGSAQRSRRDRSASQSALGRHDISPELDPLGARPPRRSGRRPAARQAPRRAHRHRAGFASPSMRAVTRSHTGGPPDLHHAHPHRDRRAAGATRPSPTIPTARRSRCWRSRCRTSSTNRCCNSSFPSVLRRRRRRCRASRLAPRRGPMGCRPLRSTPCAAASVAAPSATPRSSLSASRSPCPTSSASSPSTSSDSAKPSAAPSRRLAAIR